MPILDLTPFVFGAVLVGLGLVVYLGLAWRRSRLSLAQAARAFLRPPVLSDEADNRRAGLLTALMQPSIVVLILGVFLIFLIRHDRYALNLVILTVWAVEIYVGLYLLARRGSFGVAFPLLPARIVLARK